MMENPRTHSELLKNRTKKQLRVKTLKSRWLRVGLSLPYSKLARTSLTNSSTSRSTGAKPVTGRRTSSTPRESLSPMINGFKYLGTRLRTISLSTWQPMTPTSKMRTTFREFRRLKSAQVAKRSHSRVFYQILTHPWSL